MFVFSSFLIILTNQQKLTFYFIIKEKLNQKKFQLKIEKIKQLMKKYKKTFYLQLADLYNRKIQNQHFNKIKQQHLMNFQESFPVFELQLNCEFESSDDKFSFQRNQNNNQTQVLEDGNVTALSTIGKRNSNLDRFSYLVKDSWVLLGVFDGHGDDKVANYLKQNLLKTLSSHKFFKINIEIAIREVLEQIEEQVLQLFQKGSTVLLTVITETEIIVANVGDTKLFGLTKNEGQLVPLTKEHDLSHQTQLAQIISKGGLIFKRGNQYRINGQLNISRSIGDKKHKTYMSSKPDIYRYQKIHYKKIMLVTDGFYKHELFQKQLCKRSFKQIENKIRKGILGYGFDDNATILSYKIKSSSLLAPFSELSIQNFSL